MAKKTKEKSFFTDLISSTGNKYADIVSDGVRTSDVYDYIDTGSYILNALLSGTIYGGLPDNKTLAIAGESGTGKTYAALSIISNFLNKYEDSCVFYFDSESAVTSTMIEERGLDSTRIVIMPVSTIEDFRFQSSTILDTYNEQKIENPETPRIMLVLDSLGQLASNKEMNDVAANSDKKDMTKQALIKSTFRVLSLKKALARVPMVVTSHTYKEIGSMFPKSVMSGGCLTAGHKIQTPYGLKSIEAFQVGDIVKTIDGDKEVINTFNYTDKDVYEIEFENGYKIKCTGEHKFLVETILIDKNILGWVETIDIEPGNKLYKPVDEKDEVITVKSITKVKTEPVYDIEVDDVHYYILDNGLITHNSGVYYSADMIVFLNKSKVKDGKELTGNNIHCSLIKGRFTREGKIVVMGLSFTDGLLRYNGLLDICEKYDIFKKISTKYELPDGRKLFGKHIENNPENIFTKEILDKINEASAKEFLYGKTESEELSEPDSENSVLPEV